MIRKNAAIERIAGAFLVIAGLLGVMPAMAQSPAAYPSKPIRVLIPYSPGGSSDVMVRLVGAGMTATWGQPVVLEHAPGADTIIGVNRLLQSAPDGYTLMLGAASTYTLNPLVYDKLSYDPGRDLLPVVLIGTLPVVIIVHPSVPANSLRELVALAKSKPGELNYAEPGGRARIVAAAFTQRAAINMAAVPFKGGADTAKAVLAGTVQAGFVDPAPALPLIKSGKLRALAVTSPQRPAYLPDVPTVTEDLFPGFVETFWFGLFAPAGTPREIIDRLSAEAGRVLRTPEARERLLAFGVDAVGAPPSEFLEHLRAEARRNEQVIKTTNIRLK